MKKLTLLLSVALLATLPVRADEQTRAVQQSLKDLGFYYGQVDGQGGAETGAAIRRYQIRNGLEVTGQIDQQTLDALNSHNAPEFQESVPPPSPQPPPPAKREPPIPRNPNPTPGGDDRDFLNKETQSDNALRQPASPDYASIFRRTPYENAPREVQVSTLSRAQARLYREGFYDGAIDGLPGPATGRAILKYQSNADLRATGRLDMDTLADMNLLPGRGPGRIYPVPPPPTRRVYRGIWVH